MHFVFAVACICEQVGGIRYSTISIDSIKAGDKGTYTCSLAGSTVSEIFVGVEPGE